MGSIVEIITPAYAPPQIVTVKAAGPQGPAGRQGNAGPPTEKEGERRVGEDGFMEYSFDAGATWWQYKPYKDGAFPEWGWRQIP